MCFWKYKGGINLYKGYLTDIEGIRVGHGEDERGMTGCTVIIYDEGASMGVDVRGGAPGTRETDLFKGENLVDRVHAVVLSGGSAFGLEASSGVMNYLEENNIGFDVGVTKVPIVGSAVIFDLNIGDYTKRPDKEMGYKAAKDASRLENRQGNIGAGMGATVGKILGGKNLMKSGLGSATVEVGELKVSALVVVNSFGDIFDLQTSRQIAGVYDYENKSLLNTCNIMKGQHGEIKFSNQNTTIGVIATNAIINKNQGNKISQMAHNGLVKTINPIHTMVDGDTIFTMGTNKVRADINLIGIMAIEAMAKAVNNGVKSASSYGDLYSYSDIK